VSASLYEFRDLDLMMVLHAEGEMTSGELADALGIKDAHAVGSRGAWMRRFGMFEYDPMKKVWTLSTGGQRVVKAKRRAAALRTVEDVPDESMVDIMSHVTARYRLGDPMMAQLLRREFAYGTSPRSSVWK
jgi:hypothetical protein